MAALEDPRREAFAQAVVKGDSQADAYRAHFKVRPNTKDDSIHEAASRIANDKAVAARIRELRDTARQIAQHEFHLDVNRWLRQNVRLAFSDYRRLYKENGVLKQPHELDDDIAAAVVDVVTDSKGRVLKYRLQNKSAPMEQIGRHVGAFLADNRQRADALLEQLRVWIAENSRLPVVYDVPEETGKRSTRRTAPVGAIVPRRD